MEGEVGPQVAPPIFIRQALPGRFCEASPMSKKRDLPWQNHGFHHAHHQQAIQLNSGLQAEAKANNWNPKAWVWDSAAFIAKPAPKEVDLLRLGPEQKKKAEEVTVKGTSNEEDEENLTLKLGGTALPPPAEEPVVRANKRVRSGSPGGSGGNYPMCQVDDCKADLSNAKDYHRRHKVCEAHSKTTKALVGQQMQRFCQQCSRFHPLTEFDEGKRSCRRRLAGHNRRRRKTQPQDVSSGLVLPGNRENSGGGNLDIVNLLTILARLQGNNADKASCVPSVLDRERLIQILGKINSLPVSADAAGRSSSAGRFDLNVSHNLQLPSENMSQSNGNPLVPSTMDLLAVVSAALGASSPDKLAILSQGTSNSKNSDAKSKFNCNRSEELFSNKQMGSVALGGDERSNAAFPSPAIPEVRTSLPLQLFNSSPEDDSPPNLASSRKYFSSDSSNPMEERSPSSSPPVVQKLFPLHSSKHDKMSVSGEDNLPMEASICRGWTSPKELFKSSNSRAENSMVSNPPYQAGYTSSSGSDRSPSTSNSDSQVRTGRIMFKLFDKDPSNLPGTLKNQIFNWLSNSPSEMESYIRPGCVVLTVYASMPQFAWEELQEELLQRVSSLIKGSDSEFWKSGRFLVQTNRQLASHKDGSIRLCKSWKTWSAPELISVSPLAIVSGQETSLVLRGRNLTIPGTRVHCTYMGGYTSKEVSVPACSGTIYDDSCTENFVFPGGLSSKLGRCFIEVENGFKGNSFPVIIADATVCQELRILESEFEDDMKMEDMVTEDQYQYLERPRSREDALYFLNELGWLFQGRCSSNQLASGGYSVPRFKFLFTYSIERDWTALVRTLLDIFLERNTDSGLSMELLDMLSEVQPLNRAVKRKCRKMVDLLLHYFVNCDSNASKKYLFPPDVAGPGGLTPLHLAACTQGSEEMVDSLTNDPQEIGLTCWSSAMDENKHTPYMYASLRNYHSYNRLVARKIGDRKNGQVTIPVSNAAFSFDQLGIVTEPGRLNSQPLQSCAQCAVTVNRRLRIPGTQGFLQHPYVHSMLAIAAVCVCVLALQRITADWFSSTFQLGECGLWFLLVLLIEKEQIGDICDL